MSISALLFLKTLGNEYVIRSVRAIEKYSETHQVDLKVEIADAGVKVYDDEVLLLNIPVVVQENK